VSVYAPSGPVATAVMNLSCELYNSTVMRASGALFEPAVTLPASDPPTTAGSSAARSTPLAKFSGSAFFGADVPNAAFALSSSAVAHTATIRASVIAVITPAVSRGLSRRVIRLLSTSGSCSAVTTTVWLAGVPNHGRLPRASTRA
jgi:hypothetical protein